MDSETAKSNILIVDDDKKLCRLIRDYLEPMGYHVTMTHDGIEGLEAARQRQYQAVILDVMMPRMDGIEMLKQLRKESDVPVLMLTARGDEVDRIVGLEVGADDYLPKTFSSRELLARLRAATRRYSMEQRQSKTATAEDDLNFGELRIKKGSRTALLRGKTLTLTPLEYDLLLALTASPNRVLTRDQLLDAVVGRDYDAFDRSVDVHVSSLRRKLGDNPRDPKYIQTVRSAGYMFKTEQEPQS